jgi:hypothetical protein
MELAIPLIALGSMYMASRSSTTDNNPTSNSNSILAKNKIGSRISSDIGNEGFVNISQNMPHNIGTPPSTTAISDIENRHSTYPVETYDATELNKVTGGSLFDYPSQSQATAGYLNQTAYEEKINSGVRAGSLIPNIYSLSGNVIEKSDFIHNNMTPFMGGKIAGPLYDDKYAENILDNMTGTGAHYIKKSEQAPMFDPSTNMQFPNGTPNSSDFYQSRVNPGMSQNNTKPWDSIHVGPGLDAGYSAAGTGGFNSGMEHRDKWLPKTVDELRVDTNPKIEYSLDGHQGPVQSIVKSLGNIGEVDRKLPDSFYINSPDRWFTTTGAQKGETLRAEQPTGIIKRPNTETPYVGPAGNMDKPTTYSKNNYEPSKREPSKPQAVLGACSATVGNSKTHQNRMNNYVIAPTNRTNANEYARTYGNSIGGMFGSVVAPIMNFIKPTRKEEVVNNIRIYGDPSSSVPAEYVKPIDKPKITNKETTLYTPRSYINNQQDTSTYVNTNLALPINNRNQSNTYIVGGAGGPSTAMGGMSIEAAYNQTSNNIKSQTIHNRTSAGNMNLFNNNINMCLSKPDANEHDSRLGPATSIIKMPPSTSTYGHVVLPNKTSITEQNSAYNEKRMDPDMLKAFYNNPYTHSLSSVA